MASDDIKKILSIFSLACFLLGIFSSIFLTAFNENVASVFAIAAIVLTLVLGLSVSEELY